MIGLFGIVVSLVLLMYLAYKGFSVIILAPVLALFAVIWSGMTHELLGFLFASIYEWSRWVHH